MTVDEALEVLGTDVPAKPRTLRIRFLCFECGEEFYRTSGSRNYHIVCPHCESTDVEEEWGK